MTTSSLSARAMIMTFDSQWCFSAGSPIRSHYELKLGLDEQELPKVIILLTTQAGDDFPAY
jgi:hypothetical protein